MDVIGLSDLSFSFPDCCCESRSGRLSLNNDSVNGCLSPMVTLDGAGEARAISCICNNRGVGVGCSDSDSAA